MWDGEFMNVKNNAILGTKYPHRDNVVDHKLNLFLALHELLILHHCPLQDIITTYLTLF